MTPLVRTEKKLLETLVRFTKEDQEEDWFLPQALCILLQEQPKIFRDIFTEHGFLVVETYRCCHCGRVLEPGVEYAPPPTIDEHIQKNARGIETLREALLKRFIDNHSSKEVLQTLIELRPLPERIKSFKYRSYYYDLNFKCLGKHSEKFESYYQNKSPKTAFFTLAIREKK